MAIIEHFHDIDLDIRRVSVLQAKACRQSKDSNYAKGVLDRNYAPKSLKSE